MLDAKIVAKYLLTLQDETVDADIDITNLKLQKLLYYAQGFYLALYDKKLFKNRIEAWEHGPVVPDVYHEYKEYGSNLIPVPNDVEFNDFSDEQIELLNEVYRKYGQFSAWKLREMTHHEEPWIEARPNANEITKSSLKSFFKNYIIKDVE